MACRSGSCGHPASPKYHLLLAAAALVVAALTLAWVFGGRASGEEVFRTEPSSPIKLAKPALELLVFTDNSAPCQKIGPAIEGLIKKGWKLHVFDVRQAPSLAGSYQVSVLPTIIVQKFDGYHHLTDDNPVLRIEGAPDAAVLYAKLAEVKAKALGEPLAQAEAEPAKLVAGESVETVPPSMYTQLFSNPKEYKIDVNGYYYAKLNGEWKNTTRRFIQGPDKKWAEIVKLPQPATP